MSAPADGNYFIYNSVPSSAGDKLAVTWNGKLDDPLTVEKLVSDNTQIWQVSTSSRDQQDISPLNALGLSASWGDEGVDVSADPAVWIVREADNGYTIEDGGRTAEWGVAGETVTVKGLNDAPPTQRWVFEKISESSTSSATPLSSSTPTR